MDNQLIFSGGIDSLANGGEASIKGKPRAGGRLLKTESLHLVVRASSGANVRLSAECHHGPDGAVFVLHSTPINAADPGTSLPAVLVGDADTTKVLGEYIMIVLKIKDSALANAQWAVVELYEMRKPF